MSEIPADIMQAARDAYHSAFNEDGNARDVDIYAAISKAILAEKKRANTWKFPNLVPISESQREGMK